MHDPQARLSSAIFERLGTSEGSTSVYILWGFFALAGIAAAVGVCLTPGAERRFSAAISLPPGIAAPAEPHRIAQKPQQADTDPNKELLARLKALEDQLGTITGSISRAAPATVPSDGAGITPGAEAVQPLKIVPAPVPAPAELAEAEPAIEHTQFAIDLGPETSFSGLRARWDKLRKKYPDIAHLSPRIAVRDSKGKVELRLIAGPYENAADAARACAGLLAKGAACDGSLFDGQRLPAS